MVGGNGYVRSFMMAGEEKLTVSYMGWGYAMGHGRLAKIRQLASKTTV